MGAYLVPGVVLSSLPVCHPVLVIRFRFVMRIRARQVRHLSRTSESPCLLALNLLEPGKTHILNHFNPLQFQSSVTPLRLFRRKCYSENHKQKERKITQPYEEAITYEVGTMKLL